MMGLSRPDWLALTPKQYSLFRESWHKRGAERERETWEVARWQVFRTLCPPAKKEVSIKDIITFPWEKVSGAKTIAPPTNKERFETLKDRWK